MKIHISLTIATVLCASAAMANETPHWGYEGETGPQNWAKLKPENLMCEKGRNQSPIDISGSMRASPKPLRPVYTTGSRDIINNGHTVQVNFEPGNALTVDRVPFELKQMHFHTPSENRIAGKEFPLEAHFVHADAQGNLLVVALMFQEGPANSALAKVWAALPTKAGPASPLPNAVKPIQFMPKSMGYFRFSGSLTTPPCSEGVRWLVLKSPAPASKPQLDAFKQVFVRHNNRPVQPLNGRFVID